MNLSSEQLKDQFGFIGLSLSGGGYRAAGFHLGTIDYLHRANLLPNLQILSTVSGGTFTGAKYALAKRKGTPFDDFFTDYYLFLQNTDLIKCILNVLSAGRVDIPSKRKNVIVAAAQVYAETFMKDDDGKPIRFSSLLHDKEQHLGYLSEIIFNATEFRRGIAFRFQKSTTGGLIGNYYLNIIGKEAQELRMADIVASSSCFPGGFEPLAFPDDYVWQNESTYQTVRTRLQGPFGVMDGGVYDNQGTESMLLADGRDQLDLGMIIISDTDRQSDDLYRYPNIKDNFILRHITLGMMRWFMILMMAASLITIAVVGYNWSTRASSLWNIFTFAIPLLLSLGTGALLFTLYKFIKFDVLPNIPQSGTTSWKDFKKLNLSQLRGMLQLRITSLVSMASDIFMKRIRQLGYRSVYQNTRYDKKRISNLVYHLIPGSHFEHLPPEVSQPSDKLRDVANEAATMGTTLWFDPQKPHQQDDLIACGQFTMCYNLLKFIYRLYDQDRTNFPPHVVPYWNELVDDWNQFNEEPWFLLQSQREP